MISLTGVPAGLPAHYRFTTASGGTNLAGAVLNLTDARISNRQGGAAGATAAFQFGELHRNSNSRITSFEGGGTAIHANWQIGALNTNSDYAGVIEDGAGTTSTLTKVGTGTLTLTGANTYTGNTAVEGGTLSINNPFLADASDVLIASGAMLNLNFSGSDTIDSLFFNGVSQAVGMWGAPGSGAQFTSLLLSGTGTLTVSTFVPFVLVGDYNNNGVVDAADYVVWRDSVGAAGLTNRDPNNTGPVGPTDYASWRANFGRTGGGPAISALVAVPEPASWLLLLIAPLVAGLRRNK